MKSNSGEQSKICLKVTSVMFYWRSNLSTRVAENLIQTILKTIKNVIKSLQYPRAYLDHSSLNSNIHYTYIKIFMDRLEQLVIYVCYTASSTWLNEFNIQSVCDTTAVYEYYYVVQELIRSIYFCILFLKKIE